MQDEFAYHVRRGGAGEPQDCQRGQSRAAVFLRQELDQQCRGNRILDAHRNPDQKAQREQGLGGIDPVLGKGTDHEQGRPDEENPFATESLAQPATKEAAEENPDQCGGRDESLPEAIEV
ncbi:hypothetical protein D3C85_1163250 [compost metagenome]